jgi:8-oxo-dGTP pyrophosphatase MutT (NUDIX family)/transcriptional regulator with XRE-family HTH domain
VAGPTGSRLAGNVRALREARRLNQPQLASRMDAVGAPIHASAISKIEQRERRVDVDDLIALAIALDTTPNRLLLPGHASETEPVELAPEVTLPALDAWKWATGEEPLPAGYAPPDRQMLVRDDRERYFTRENQPHNLPEPYFRNVGHDVREYPAVVRMAAALLLEAREHGMQLGALTRLVEHLDMRRRFGQLDDLLGALSGIGNGQPQQRPVVAVIVTSGLGVLVGRRNDGSPPWGFISGEVEPGEDPDDAAVREVKEETGCEIEPIDVIGERVHPATGRTMIYMAARPVRGTDVFVGDESELAEVRWVGLAEADDLLPDMFPPVRAYLARELAGDEAGS